LIEILYVDDEADLLEIGKLFLERSDDIRVDTADSVTMAWNKMDWNQYDAIISDYQMPGTDGINFLKALRSKGDKIPFILFTGRGREEVVIEALNSGADFYLQKGGNPNAQFIELEHKVREAVRRNRAENALRENEERLSKAQIIGLTGCWEFRWDVDGGHMWGSEECYSMFGIPRTSDGVIPLAQQEACILDKGRAHQALQNLIEKGTGYNLEYEICPADGGPNKFIRSVAELIRDEAGIPSKVVGIIQDITERRDFDRRVHRLNRELVAIKECNRSLVKAQTEQELLDEICRIVCQVADYRMAWIGMVEHDEARSVRPVAWSGYDQEYVVSIKATWGGDERGNGPTGTSIKTGRTSIVQDLANDERMGPWRDAARRNGYRSTIALPLLDSGIAFGAFMLYSELIDGFTADELDLLEEMAGDLAYGILALRAKVVQEKADKALKASDERFRTLFNANNDTTWVIDQETGAIMDVNPAATMMYGLSREEFTALNIRDISSDPQATWRALHPVAALVPLRYHKRKDGSVFPVEIASSVVTIDGRPTVIGTARDITERLKAEKDLRHERDRAQAYLDMAGFIFLTLDKEGRITMLNKAGCRILGCTEPPIGREWTDFVPERFRTEVAQRTEEVFSGRRGMTEYRENLILTLSGEERLIAWHNTFLQDDAGTMTGSLSSGEDITDRKTALDTITEANKKLSLLSRITLHDVQSQLIILNGLIQRTKKGAIQPSLKEDLVKMQQATEKIQSNLTFARDYQNLGRSPPAWHRLKECLLDQMSSFDSKYVQLELEGCKWEMFSDAMLNRVFYNLLDNTVRHGQKATKVIVSARTQGEVLLISYTDNGIGLPSGKKKEVFEIREGESKSHALMMAREILGITGITIIEKGVPGQGAFFEIRVPAASFRRYSQ
jgi:PAS domain S-box-containing protein